MNSRLAPGLFALFIVCSWLPGVAHAACEGESLISETFDNGARWELCWESRIRENLVLSDIIYTPPGGDPLPVLSSARLSQLHVAYDDNDVTYNDITQYGLGGGYLLELLPEDCPLGELMMVQTRPAVCRWRSAGEDSYRTANRSVSAQSLNLFSVSQVGAYAYIISWTFYSDGAIEPRIGATGALQRSSSSLELPFGRVLQGDPDTLWLSHTHNYHWRLDFDLGDSATDDVVTETWFQVAADGRRETRVDRFNSERARRIDPETLQAWHIWDKLDGDQPDETTRGYLIEPIHHGHRYVRQSIEPYTDFDFFVTVANDCERFASQNARFNPDCLNNVLQYVNDESLVDQDLVIWHRVAFHHLPRSEDQRNMHTHWDGFVIEPVNVLAGSPGFDSGPNEPPELDQLANLQHRPGEAIDFQINAVDPDGDELIYSATGLPPGIQLSTDGRLFGTTEAEGSYVVAVQVSDDREVVESAFMWNIKEKRRTGFGLLSSLSLLGLLAGLALRRVVSAQARN